VRRRRVRVAACALHPPRATTPPAEETAAVGGGAEAAEAEAAAEEAAAAETAAVGGGAAAAEEAAPAPAPAKEATEDGEAVEEAGWRRAFARLVAADEALRAARGQLESDAARPGPAEVEAALGRARAAAGRLTVRARAAVRVAVRAAEGWLRDGGPLRGLSDRVAQAEADDGRAAAWRQVPPRAVWGGSIGPPTAHLTGGG
jgi:hypothetical protein